MAVVILAATPWAVRTWGAAHIRQDTITMVVTAVVTAVGMGWA